MCNMRSRFSAPVVPVLAPSDSFKKSFSTESATSAAVVLRDAAIALIGRPSATLVQELLVVGGEAGVVGDRRDERLDDLRVDHRPAGRDLADGPRELVALGHAVLEEVGVPGRALAEQRDRVVGVVVLREHHHPGARVALPQLLGRVDALLLEARRHPDVGDEHLGRQRLGAGEEAVVVVGGADHLEVGLEREDRPHAFPDDHVVVGEEHRDPTVSHGTH